MLYWGYTGIMETNIMGLYRFVLGFRDCIGIMEKKTETIGTRLKGLYRVYVGIVGNISGLYPDNGKENGHYYGILGLWFGV